MMMIMMMIMVVIMIWLMMISWFFQIYKSVSNKLKSSAFKELIKKRDKINITGGTSEQSAEGTKHSYSDAEKAAFADWINYVLEDDADCKRYLPFSTSSESDDIFEKCKDGILLWWVKWKCMCWISILVMKIDQIECCVDQSLIILMTFWHQKC